ncbi:MAG: LPS export ABC transporter permease LptG [Steroidobacteraceae bacterium]
MSVLDRYILRSVVGAVALVLLVLLTLAALFLFISQQQEVGTGNYGGLQALRFVVLSLPEQFFEFLPIAALMGSLIGMGVLAHGSELTVMRAAGISTGRIGLAMALAGVAIAVVAGLTAEFVAPAAGDMARTQKALAKFSNISFAGRGGAWARDGRLFVKAEALSPDGALGGITVFALTPDNRLELVGHARRGAGRAQGGWELHGYSESRFIANRIVSVGVPVHHLDTGLSAGFLGLAVADPSDLSMRELWRAITYLDANGQDTRSWRYAFWSIAAQVAAIPFAVLLALPFLFGSLRAAGNGARATLGLVLGLAYFILQRMVASGTIAFQLDPLLLAWLPTAVLALAVAVLIARMRLTGAA